MSEHFESGGDLLIAHANHPDLSVRHTAFVLNMPANPVQGPSVWQLMVPKNLSQVAAEYHNDPTFQAITDSSFMDIMNMLLMPQEDTCVWADIFDLAERCQVDELFDCIEETGGQSTFSNRNDLLALHKVNRLRKQLLLESESSLAEAESKPIVAGPMTPAASSSKPAKAASEDAELSVPSSPSSTRNASLSSSSLPARKLPKPSLSSEYLQAAFSHLQLRLFKTTPPSSPTNSKETMDGDYSLQEVADQHQAEEQRAQEKKKKKRKDQERARVKRRKMEKKLDALAKQVEADDSASFDLEKAEAKYMLDRAKEWAAETGALEKKHREEKQAKQAQLASSRARLNELLAQAAVCAEELKAEEKMWEEVEERQLDFGEPQSPELEEGITPEDIIESYHQVSIEKTPGDAAANNFQESATATEKVSDEADVIDKCLEGGKVLAGDRLKDATPPVAVEEGDESSIFVQQSESEVEVAVEPGAEANVSPSRELKLSENRGSGKDASAAATITDSSFPSSSSFSSDGAAPAPSRRLPPMEPVLPDLKKLQSLLRRVQGQASTDRDSTAKVFDGDNTNIKSTEEQLGSPSPKSRTQSVGSVADPGPLNDTEHAAQDIGCEQQESGSLLQASDHDAGPEVALTSSPAPVPALGVVTAAQDAVVEDSIIEDAVVEAAVVKAPAFEVPVTDDPFVEAPVIETHNATIPQAAIHPVVRLPLTAAYAESPQTKIGSQPHVPFTGPSRVDTSADGQFDHTVSVPGPQELPPAEYFQQTEPGFPVHCQQWPTRTPDRMNSQHLNGSPIHNFPRVGRGPGQFDHPEAQGVLSTGGPPTPYYAQNQWQGSHMPPPMQPIPFAAPAPQMLSAPMPINRQFAPNMSQVVRDAVHAPGPQAYQQWQPSSSLPRISEQGVADFGSPPAGPVPPAHPQIHQETFMDAATQEDESEAPDSEFSTPFWLSQDIYPANATVTFRPKGKNQPLDGVLTGTNDGVELDVPAGWLQHLLEDEGSSWEIETVKVRRRQRKKPEKRSASCAGNRN